MHWITAWCWVEIVYWRPAKNTTYLHHYKLQKYEYKSLRTWYWLQWYKLITSFIFKEIILWEVCGAPNVSNKTKLCPYETPLAHRGRASYMHPHIRPPLVQIMDCHLFGTKPLRESMMTNWWSRLKMASSSSGPKYSIRPFPPDTADVASHGMHNFYHLGLMTLTSNFPKDFCGKCWVRTKFYLFFYVIHTSERVWI